jgi:hypothetical protein
MGLVEKKFNEILGINPGRNKNQVSDLHISHIATLMINFGTNGHPA